MLGRDRADLIIAFFFRYSSLAALVAAVFAPLFDVFLFGTGHNPVAWAVLAMSVLLVWRHRGNIAKLLAGQESRIGDKKKAAADGGAQDGGKPEEARRRSRARRVCGRRDGVTDRPAISRGSC